VARAAFDPFDYLKTARFDPGALFEALDARRARLGMSWREVAAQIGVSVSTLTRTQDATRMEAAGALTAIAWLGVPPETFLRPAGSRERPDLMTQFSNLLGQVTDGSPEAVAEITEIIGVALTSGPA
jgi:transcriptional regulator with XRE-family HTH domain